MKAPSPPPGPPPGDPGAPPGVKTEGVGRGHTPPVALQFKLESKVCVTAQRRNATTAYPFAPSCLCFPVSQIVLLMATC